MKRILVIGLAALFLLGGCGGGDEVRRVDIKTFIFKPDPLTVDAGTKVTFKNLDGTFHTVTAGTRERPRPSRFDHRLGEGDEVTIEFTRTGRVAYFCSLHSGDGMVGEVIVR